MEGESTLLDQRPDRLQYECQQNDFFQGLESWYQGERTQGGVGACAFSRTTYLPNTIKIQPVKIVKTGLQQQSCQVERIRTAQCRCKCLEKNEGAKAALPI